MKRNNITDLREGLKAYFHDIDLTVPRLSGEFNKLFHNKICLRLGTMMMHWVKAAIQLIDNTSYEFDSWADDLFMDPQFHDNVK